MNRLAFRNFEIELNIGKYIRTALFLNGQSTKYLVNSVVKLINSFEQTFKEPLQDWHGDVTKFATAADPINKFFKE